MLLQSRAGETELLPALPKEWPAGSITGLRARGGYEVSLKWTDGKLASATVKNVSGTGHCTIRYGAKVIDLDLKQGESKVMGKELQ